jgi:ferredoxin
MHIVVNLFLCDGNGLCAREAPDIFSVDENDTLHVLKERLGEEDLAPARRAVGACPKAALSIAE